MSDLNSTFDLLNGRSKSLPTDRYAYKLTEDHFAMDFVVSDALEVDESKMSAWILFADGRRRDGVGDLLEVGGIDTERHEKNRIVLFDHGKGNHVWSNWPIAKTEDPETGAYTVVIDPVMKIAKANAFFYQGKGLPGAHASADRDFGLHCQQLFDLWAKKFISGGSIGYQVKAARELSPDYETGVPKGLHLLSTLMLECSMVVLPANMDTVKSLRTQGDVAREILAMPTVCGKPLSPYLVKSLQQYAPPKKAMLGWEDRKSTEVPVPTGDLNDTKIPPVKWTPGVGAECKDVEDYPVAPGDDVEQKTLPKQGQKAIVLDDALIIGLIGAGTVGIGYLVNQVMRWMHDIDEDEFHSRLRKMEKEGKIIIRDGNVSVVDPAQHRNVKALRSRYRRKSLGADVGDRVILFGGAMGVVIAVDPSRGNLTVQLANGDQQIAKADDIAAVEMKSLRYGRKGWSLNTQRKDFPTDPNARKILHGVLMGEISPGDAVGMLIKAGMRREQAEREVRLTVQSISSLNQKLLHRKDLPIDPNVRKVLKALIYGMIDESEAVDLLMRRAGMSREDAQKEVGVTTQEMGHYPKSLRGEKRVQIDEESDGWYVRFIPEVVEGVDYRDDMGPFESMEEAESTVRRKYPHQFIDCRNKLGGKSKAWRVVKESDGWWVRGYNEDSEDEGPFESEKEARDRLGNPNFPAGYSHRYKSLQVKFNWNDNPNGTAYEHRRIWISQNDGSPRQVTFAELHSMLGEEAAKQAIKTSIRQGTSRWHEVKSLWDYAVTYKVVGDGITLYEGENEQAANRSAQAAKRSGKYQSVILHDSGLGETRVKRGQKSITMLALGVMSLVSATLAGLKLSDILWELTRGDESKENEVLNAVERLQREGKVEIVGDRVVRKRGGSPMGKSLDLSSTRKKYRPTKGLRRRLRKSAPGVSVMHVASKDIDAARELAETSGVKFAHVGNNGGFAKVKLIGADDGIDAVAREYGKRIKSLPNVRVKADGTCKPGERADLTGCTPANAGPRKPSRQSKPKTEDEARLRDYLESNLKRTLGNAVDSRRKEAQSRAENDKIRKQREEAEEELAAYGSNPEKDTRWGYHAQENIARLRKLIAGLRDAQSAAIDNSAKFNREAEKAEKEAEEFQRELGRKPLTKSLRGTMSSKNGSPKQKDMRVYTTPRAGSDIPPNARRVLDSAGLLFSYAKPGDTGGWHLVYPRGTDLQRVINTLKQVGIHAVEMDNGVYFEGGKSLRGQKGVVHNVMRAVGMANTFPVGGRVKIKPNGLARIRNDEGRDVPAEGVITSSNDTSDWHAVKWGPGIDDWANFRANELQEKSLRRKGKSMDTDDVMIEDEAYGKGMDDESNWPVGAQVLKRLLEDHKQLLQDYDEMMGPLEHDGVKTMLQKKLEAIAGELDEWETAVGKHYPDYNDSIIGQVGHKEIEEEEDIDVEDIDGELDELNLDEDVVEDVVEDKDMDTMDDAGIPADSDPEPEPTAEEALEGMEYKRLRGRHRRKSLEEDEEEKRLFRRWKDLEEEEVIEEEKNLRGRRKSACDCNKEPCECGKALRSRRKDFEEEMVEMDVEPKGLESHELAKVGEASQHAKDLAGKEQLEEEDRMKSFHYHKTLEGMAAIEDMASEGKSEFVGDPEFWAEEAVETEHKDLPPGEIGADMPNPEDVPGQPVAKQLHPHRKACKDASIFFGDAARTKDWGETHRQDAEAVAKALEEISAAPSDAAPPPEEEGFEVGEMGEKGRKKAMKTHSWHKNQDVTEELDDEAKKMLKKTLMEQRKQLIELQRMGKALNGLSQSR